MKKLLTSLVLLVILSTGAFSQIKTLPIQLINSSELEAFSNETDIYISTGMLEFLHDEAFIKMVLYHELGHIILKHIKKSEKSITKACGFKPTEECMRGYEMVHSEELKKQELEADFFSIVMMKRDGYDGRVCNIWNKFSDSLGDNPSYTHPSDKERLNFCFNVFQDDTVV